jgi:hypothetical protein
VRVDVEGGALAIRIAVPDAHAVAAAGPASDD